MKQIAHKYWLKAICKTSECKTNKHWMLCYRSPVHKTATVSNGKWWVVRAPQPTRTNSQQPVDCLYFFFNILGEWAVRLPICGVCLLRDKQNRCQSVTKREKTILESTELNETISSSSSIRPRHRHRSWMNLTKNKIYLVITQIKLLPLKLRKTFYIIDAQIGVVDSSVYTTINLC